MTEPFVSLNKRQAKDLAEALGKEIKQFVSTNQEAFEKFLAEEAQATKESM